MVVRFPRYLKTALLQPRLAGRLGNIENVGNMFKIVIDSNAIEELRVEIYEL